MKHSYITSGTCSKSIEFEINGEMVHSVKFCGGCNGNLKGIAALTEGLPVNVVIQKLKGIKCRDKSTSCPDQLAKALEQIQDSMQQRRP